MTQQPILQTERLSLRPFKDADAPEIEKLAGAFEVADTTLTIPHPYPAGAAQEWIATHQPGWDSGKIAAFGLVERSTDTPIGAILLTMETAHSKAELGFWVGVPHWNQGYCTEAARRMLAFAFEERMLHRVEARHFVRNPASGRVMQKIGMHFEGIQREALRRWDQFEDVAYYGILESDWTELVSR